MNSIEDSAALTANTGLASSPVTLSQAQQHMQQQLRQQDTRSGQLLRSRDSPGYSPPAIVAVPYGSASPAQSPRPSAWTEERSGGLGLGSPSASPQQMGRPLPVSAYNDVGFSPHILGILLSFEELQRQLAELQQPASVALTKAR